MAVGTETVRIRGRSGSSYEFGVYPLESSFKDLYSAVYAVLNGVPGAYGVVYVGQTGDLGGRMRSHHKATCFTLHGGRFLAVRHVFDEPTRLYLEADLVAALRPRCNG